MFTGIIKILGEVKDIKESKEEGKAMILEVDIKDAEGLRVGDSIAINGACLTIVGLKDSIARFELVRETIDKTALGVLKKGDVVNVEKSLKVGDSIDGHFVLGHVDGIAEIVEKRKEEGQTMMYFKVRDKDLMRDIARKGSIAVDGISLTIVDVNDDTFSIALIPHTLANTTLGFKDKGDLVNIEVDVLSRYVERLNLPQS